MPSHTSPFVTRCHHQRVWRARLGVPPGCVRNVSTASAVVASHARAPHSSFGGLVQIADMCRQRLALVVVGPTTSLRCAVQPPGSSRQVMRFDFQQAHLRVVLSPGTFEGSRGVSRRKALEGVVRELQHEHGASALRERRGSAGSRCGSGVSAVGTSAAVQVSQRASGRACFQQLGPHHSSCLRCDPCRLKVLGE